MFFLEVNLAYLIIEVCAVNIAFVLWKIGFMIIIYFSCNMMGKTSIDFRRRFRTFGGWNLPYLPDWLFRYLLLKIQQIFIFTVITITLLVTTLNIPINWFPDNSVNRRQRILCFLFHLILGWIINQKGTRSSALIVLISRWYALDSTFSCI